MATAEVIDLTGLPSSSPVRFYSNDRTHDVDQTIGQLKNPTIDKDAAALPEDGELPRAAKPTAAPQKQRKRKKPQPDPAAPKEENAETGDKRRRRGGERDEPPRRNSRSPDRATRGHALREIPSESLFFVDDKPADVRAAYGSATLAGPSTAQRNDGLVLPPHVNVAGSSETQEPPLSDVEEDEEDFIDYLDVDGDRSVCIPFTKPLPLCTLIQEMKI